MQSNTPPVDSRTRQQGELVWAQYPLTDKIDKLKKRPVLVISNSLSNSLDNDLIVLPITKTIRTDRFSLIIEPEDVAGDLPITSELRCNKPFTVRGSLLHESIGQLNSLKMEQATRLLHDAIVADQESEKTESRDL
jgi:mRNA-degrading endonuclease toxin of MazEF toxin-antitoxin module